jgi:hypothetical protein
VRTKLSISVFAFAECDSMKNLPLPFFKEIYEAYAADWKTSAGWTSLALICPDPSAGRYTRCIGRELDIVTARAVARRSMTRDSRPLSDVELRHGRTPCERLQDASDHGGSIRVFYAKPSSPHQRASR